MADMMVPPKAGGYGSAASDPVRGNMSIMNPADLAYMQNSGDFANLEKQTVGDVLQKFGIDLNGPATQLVEFAQKQVQNADPAGKMQNIASATMGEDEPAADTGLEGLLQGR